MATKTIFQNRFNRRLLYTSLGFMSLLLTTRSWAQESYSQYQNHMFRHYDRYVYQADQRFHTSVKPFLTRQTDSIVNIDSLYRIPVKRKGWDILFNRSLIQLNKDYFAFTIDPLMQFELGTDLTAPENSWINTRGFLINGRIGKNFTFSTSFTENQSMYNDYRKHLVQMHGVMPGQGRPKAYKETGYDYGVAEGYVNYQAGKYFNFQLGHGKNFIGDGYRSLLLSDYAFSYPYFKITTDVWHLKYMMLWTQFQDLVNPHPYGEAYDKKWGAFHYLDWVATPWLTLGLFESVIWQNADSTAYRGFDFNYANPLIFFRPVEFAVGSPDNVLFGGTGKITLFKQHVFYGQFLLDEFKLDEIKNFSNGWWANKFALQGGYKTFDLFGLKHLDIQTEVNFVRPFMYSHLSSLKNYGHYNEGLAHPSGSNFIESVTFLRYNYKRLFFEGRFSHTMHGSDTAGMNYGNDIYKSYDTRAQDEGNFLGQASEVNLNYLQLQLAWLVNPQTNLNVYLSYTQRNEKTASAPSVRQTLITMGIRTSLQNLYYDF